jgi:Double zinc ribbon
VSDTLVLEIVLVVVLVVVCVAVGLLAWQVLRRRRDKLRSEIDASKASVEERAFNRIHIARSAADHLEKNGADVAGPRRLLDQASKSFDAGRHDDALALASSAHEALLKKAQAPAALAPAVGAMPGATAPSPVGSSPGPTIEPAGDPPMATDPASEPPASPTGRLPRNKAESHFQLRLLDEELAAGGPGGTPPSVVREVTALSLDAHSSYEKGDYTEALRVALKGRRSLGARLETLPPPSVVAAPAPTDAAPATSDGGTADRCRQCGQPLRSGDKFCRGCGAAITASNCARCGESLDGVDQFCGRCGAPRPS